MLFNIHMWILPINSYNTQKPNFKSCVRIYSPKSLKNNDCFGKDKIRTSTNLFREDLDWFGLAKFVIKHFNNKETVNIHSVACSDGSEAYTFAISLMENIPSNILPKFLPIKASDIDPVVLNFANGKRINIEPIEFFLPEKRYECELNKYFNNQEVSVMLPGDTQSESDCISSYQPIPKLADAVTFHQADILSEINNLKDNGNTVVMCRNVFPYLNKSYIDKVIQSARNKLKSGSLFVIGDYDDLADIDKKLLNNGFHQPIALKSNFINCENVFLRA